MPNTAQEIYRQVVSALPLDERLSLATLILNDLVEQNVSIIQCSDTWTEQDKFDLISLSLHYSAMLSPEDLENQF
ncbi:hypothetical protein [Gloeothece verrucosa]|uniref:Uncharacterized protein n=1 Tax=Gloeothece verrucosa (strain PCC 7822) TaxID=497965 RepID=E0UGN9_GLOV7|nr:hypothetical protein [Gloeothece verrucosa]ADN13248.1 conserved hypothetical protein [Gloeothece verrucosa PCC 7822]